MSRSLGEMMERSSPRNQEHSLPSQKHCSQRRAVGCGLGRAWRSSWLPRLHAVSSWVGPSASVASRHSLCILFCSAHILGHRQSISACVCLDGVERRAADMEPELGYSRHSSQAAWSFSVTCIDPCPGKVTERYSGKSTSPTRLSENRPS